MRGRKPTPTVLKLLRGNPGKRAINKAEPKPGPLEVEMEHPAVYPVALPAFAIQCWPGRMYEPFCGSGSTLLAAEQFGAQCFANEIEPRYVQVAIDRWEAFTGQKAQKVGEVALAS